MSMKLCGFEVGLDRPFFLIAGPCVVESEQLQMDTAGTLKEICAELGIAFIFKSSYDKANRSSGSSFRGPGMAKGLEILAKVKRELQLPILTDVHTEADIAEVSKVVDVLQTPAFLCRQTDFIRAVAQSATTTWSATCAAWPSCVRQVRPWSLMPPTLCNCPVDKAPALAVNAKWCPFCRVLPWRWV